MKNGTNGKDHKIAYIDGVAHPIKSEHTSVLKFVREYVGKDKVPSLCDDPNLAPYGACRVCSAVSYTHLRAHETREDLV